MDTIRIEARRILDLHDGSLREAIHFLADEHNVLQTRGHSLMALAGVVVTVTGFSGRIIAGTSLPAQISVSVGLSMVVMAAIWVYAKVLRIRWMSRDLVEHENPLDILEAIIRRRDTKTDAFQRGGFLLCAGFAFYCVAIALMLLFPDGLALPVR